MCTLDRVLLNIIIHNVDVGNLDAQLLCITFHSIRVNWVI
jgi:hypothetical protein